MSIQSTVSRIIDVIEEASKQYSIDATELVKRLKELNYSDTESHQQALSYALNRISIDQPNWTFVAASLYLEDLYKKVSEIRGYCRSKKYGDFYDLIKGLTDKGIYSKDLLKQYSIDEINELKMEINPTRDHLFNFIGLFLLADRYLAKDHDKNLYELPQERFMVIAMTIMQQEKKDKRMELVKEAYWALSNLYMTVATPTLANAGKSHGQLSSCFIDTVDDSLDGIYLNNWDIARLSKDGGGIGVY